MANNFGLGFTFTGVDKFSGTVGRVEGAYKRVQAAAKKTGESLRDASGRFLPKGAVAAASPTGNGRDASGRFLPKGTNATLGGAAANIRKVERGLFDMAKKAALSKLSVQALGTALGNLGANAITGAFTAVKGGIVGAASASIDFESAMADVNKVLPEGTELQPIADGAKQLAKDIGILPNQVANLTASLAQSGIAGDELTLVAGDASRLAVAFGMSGEESGQALAKLRTGLGLTRPEVNNLTGTINELSNKLAATAPEITDAVQRVGSVAKAANISAESAAGLATAMIASGASAEVAATGTKTFLRSLGAGDAATKRQRAAFKALGLDSADVAKRLTAGGESAEATIRDVVSRIGDLDQADKLPNLIRLFGSESIGAIGPLAGNIKLLNQAFEISGNKVAAQGSVLKEYETRSKTTGAAIDRLKANFAVLAIEIGDRLKPIVVAAINGFTWLIDKSRVWGADMQALGARVSAFASTFDIFGDIRLMYQGLVQVFSQGGFSGAVRKELGYAENSGIKKFVIRVYMLFGRLRVFFEGIASGFMKAWDIVGPKFITLFESLKAIAVSLFNVFAAEGDEVATSSMNSWRVWGDALGSAIGTVLDWTVSLIGGFASLLATNEWLVKSIVYGVIAIKAFRLGLALVKVGLAASALAVKAYTFVVATSGKAMKIAAVGMKIFRLATAGVTLAMKALRIAALSNPIIALITGIVLGAALIYKYWGPIKEFFIRVWDAIVQAFDGAMTWINEQIALAAKGYEDLLMMFMTTEQAEMYVKLKAEKAEEDKQATQLKSKLFDRTEGEGYDDAGMRAKETLALERARTGASNAPVNSLAERVSMGAASASAAAESMGAMIAKRVAEAQEVAAAQKATGGGNMSVNLIVDGEKMAAVTSKASKNGKARTFSQVDPRDDDE